MIAIVLYFGVKPADPFVVQANKIVIFSTN